MNLLRFATAGSVDDGKSTLIGRLLYECKGVFDDQIQNLEQVSARRGFDHLNLAFFTDGLKAEREQGITIDVAYRYFSTPKRKFILGDCPGHAQYTRNMLTAASKSDLLLLVVDASRGVREQTRMHLSLASILQMTNIVVCVNKMDLVEYKESIFEEIRDEFKGYRKQLELPEIVFIPISALEGEGVSQRSNKMPWYNGPSLLQHLEQVQIPVPEYNGLRVPVQMSLDSDETVYAASVSSGVLCLNSEVQIFPRKLNSRIKRLNFFTNEIEEAIAPMAITFGIDEEIILKRGEMLVAGDTPPQVGNEFELMLCWLDGRSLDLGQSYSLMHTTNSSRCRIKKIHHKLNLETLQMQNREAEGVKINDIVKVTLQVDEPLVYDAYKNNKATGSLILIDEQSNATCAAGVIL